MDPEGTLMSNSNAGHGGGAVWGKGQESSEANLQESPISRRRLYSRTPRSDIHLQARNNLPF